jgi:hypothetical protein
LFFPLLPHLFTLTVPVIFVLLGLREALVSSQYIEQGKERMKPHSLLVTSVAEFLAVLNVPFSRPAALFGAAFSSGEAMIVYV